MRNAARTLLSIGALLGTFFAVETSAAAQPATPPSASAPAPDAPPPVATGAVADPATNQAAPAPAVAAPPTSSSPALAKSLPLKADPTPATPASSLRVRWRDDWPRFHPAEYAITGALIAGVVAFNFAGGAETPRWTSRNVFDEAVRDGIRGNSAGTRRTAQDISDSFYYLSLAYPILDSTIGMWAVRKSGDVASQQFLITLEAMAVTGFLSFVSNSTIARERAYVRTCSDKDPPDFPSCEAGGKADGFFSGHTAMAITSAAATCSHHAHVPLYGQVGDVIACVSALGGATATGVLRLVADKHYATDIITGMALGLASGILIPELHYRFGKAPPGASIGLGRRFMPLPVAMPQGGGLAVVGILD